jgi:beta-N-acetylhexosaminidase
MNTPERFSQAWGRQQQPGQFPRNDTPSPFTPPNARPPSWNGSGMPNVTSNLGMPQTPLRGTSSLGARPPRRNASQMGKVLLFFGLALLLVTTSVACVSLLSTSGAPSGSAANAQSTVQSTPTPTAHMQHELLASQYVANMSLDDEIAQLLMVEHYDASYSPDLNIMMNQQHVGSVILYKTAIVTREQVKSNIELMQQKSNIPAFVAIDEEGWNVGRLGALYPNYYSYRKDAHAISLSGDSNVAAQQGEQAGKDLLSLGINMNLAPDVDVSTDDGYIGYDRRSFGSTPDEVIKYAGPYLKALQTTGIVGSIKHFPGLGSIPKGFDPHAVLPEYTGTKDELYQTDLVPFKHFVQSSDPYEQAYVVMSTDMLVKSIDPTYPVELSHKFITDILRNELGFKGVILSDSLHMGGVLVNGEVLSLADACVLALEAGNDILEGASTSIEVQNIIDAVKDAVQSGKLTKAQIDASVERVLALKMDFNVMPAVAPSSATPTATVTAPNQ